MSYCTYIASDYPLRTVEREIKIDMVQGYESVDQHRYVVRK